MKKIMILIFVMLLLTGCGKQTFSKSFFSMDTYITVKVYDSKHKKFLEDVENIFAKYHNLSSAFIETGYNVYYINEELKKNVELEIDADLAKLIKYSLEMNKETNNVFNPCLGNVTRVWKEYRDGVKTGVPPLNDLKKAGSIACQDITLNDNKIMKKSDVKLDLGGIAKGYAAEEARIYLENNGVKEYLISAGGNVVVGEHFQKDKQYLIGLQSPINSGEIFKTVNVTKKAVVTSGSYERFYEFEGVKYSHIIDAKTLFPSNHVKSVTVLASSSAEADIMSTYLFSLPYEEAYSYVESHDDLEAVWFLNNNEIKTSSGIARYE